MKKIRGKYQGKGNLPSIHINLILNSGVLDEESKM
jgi:hypothetical protein